MSQPRVTDFFAQRKRAGRGSSKSRPAGPKDAGLGFTGPKDAGLGSAVHQEFLRVVDEAAGLSDAKAAPLSPATPKRTCADAAVFSATAEHSTAKKKPKPDAGAPGRPARRTARKKLVLPQPQTANASRCCDVAELPLTPEASAPGAARVPQTATTIGKSESGPSVPAEAEHSGQTRGKEDISALKLRLQRIKKLAEEKTSAPPSSCSSPDAAGLKSSLARAKELAARAQRRTEEDCRRAEPPAQESAELPAYQRYHTLAQDVPPGLSLPYHYKLLAEMFRSMDTVVAMLHNRSETATFAKIKQGVQDMMHKRFEEQHVGQVKTVYPEAYAFRQEKNVPSFSGCNRKGSYQLTVEPLIHSECNETRPLLSASRLLERRHTFHLKLVTLVKQHHKAFLSSLVPPVSVPEDKLTRWHPRFNVDTVPAVASGELPRPPSTDRLATAQEVLDKARSIITPRMEKALVTLAAKSEESKETKPMTTQAPPAAAVPSALKGVSQSLLERIRAKEAQKIQVAMTRNASQEERLAMLQRLGELARILRSVFVAEKKPALTIEVACNRMVSSYRSALSAGEMEKHVRLLAEVAPGWLTIHPVRKDFYLKLNKAVELSLVLEQLSSRVREEERLSGQ